MIKLLEPDNTNIAFAAKYLLDGNVLAFPTETVYGLGANAYNDQAVQKIYAIKSRPYYNPLIAHYCSLESLDKDTILLNLAIKLLEKFAPGPLTLVLPRKQNSLISSYATANLASLAIRIPSNSIAQALLKKIEVPIVAPSANQFQHISATSPEHIIKNLEDKLEYVLDGGNCNIGLESTIISLIDYKPVLLREGAIATDIIEDYLSIKIANNNSKKIVAPGMMQKHYSPKCKIRFGYDNPRPEEGLLAFGQNIPRSGFKVIYNLSNTEDLREAASKLYLGLHYLESQQLQSIAVMPIPNKGIGKAINDRFKRMLP